MTLAAEAHAAPETPPTGPVAAGTRGRVAAFAPGVTAVLVVAAILLASGVPAIDLLRYAGYALWGVLLPGTLVYRALRGTRHSLLDDLVWGAALGLALEVAAYVTFSATGLRGLLWCWPVLVVAPFLAVGRLRRHWRPTGGAPVPLAWAWAVAAGTVWLAVYIAAVFVSLEPIDPKADHYYFVDLNYLLSLAGEAKHHFPPHAPQVAGEPLLYHWFSAAHMASASLVSGVALPAVFYGLAVPALAVVLVPMLALAGWRVTGRPWVGVVAVGLTFVVGELAVGTFFFLGDITKYIIWSSPSQTYSYLSTIPLLVLIADAVRDRRPVRSGGWGRWALMALFALQASGSKASGIPVLLAGLAVASLVDLVRRRRIAAPVLLSAAVLTTAYLIATAVLFRFESHGLRISPGATVELLLGNPALRPTWKNVVIWLAAVGAFALFMLVRLAGIWFAARYGRPWGTIEWFLLGTLVAGVGAALVIRHPSWSQMFFLRSAWPAGAILSALGAVLLVERHRVPPRWVALGVGAAATVALAVGAAVEVLEPWPGGPLPGQAMAPIYGVVAILLAVAAVGAVGWHLARRWIGAPAGAGAVAALALVLVAGLPILPHDMYASQRFGPAGSNPSAASRVGPTETALAAWVRANVGVDEVIATNEHCLGPNEPGCLKLQFWFSAYTERRVLVGGWGYVPRAIVDSARTGVAFGRTEFWDQRLLADNDAVFTAPTAENTRLLRERYGVRWLYVNRRSGPEPPALADYADLRFTIGDYAIYELRPG